MIVRRALRQAGFGDHEVMEAANGKEALERIAETTPAVVLSDWNMPEMTGFELLQELRARGNKVPFGFVTSEGSDAMRAKANDAGARFLIAKPFTKDTFVEKLSPILG